jgi:cytochrome c
MGRRAATQPGFAYSKALLQANFVWTAVALEQWIADPNAMVPGNHMVVRLADDPADRVAIVAYLAHASGD